mgnify:FL=1
MIGHTSIPQAVELEKACRKAFGKAPLTTFNLGGVVSANTGPDTLALVYVARPETEHITERLLLCGSLFSYRRCIPAQTMV